MTLPWRTAFICSQKDKRRKENYVKTDKSSCSIQWGTGQYHLSVLSKEKYEEVIALSFNYGQKHSDELICAKEICKKYGVEHHILDMALLNQLAPNSLTRADIEVDKEAPETGTPNSFVDGRNMLFLTFAAVFAKQRDIHVLVTGVSQSDFSGYPDCRHVFITSLETTLTLAMDYEFEVITPLMWIDKKKHGKWPMIWEYLM